MKKSILLIVVLSFTLVCFSSNNVEKKDEKNKTSETKSANTNISGKIIDEQTGEALAGVQVNLVEMNQVVYTDFEGNFEFQNLQKGKYTIETNLISYKQSVNENINSEIKSAVNIKLSGL